MRKLITQMGGLRNKGLTFAPAKCGELRRIKYESWTLARSTRRMDGGRMGINVSGSRSWRFRMVNNIMGGTSSMYGKSTKG